MTTSTTVRLVGLLVIVGMVAGCASRRTDSCRRVVACRPCEPASPQPPIVISALAGQEDDALAVQLVDPLRPTGTNGRGAADFAGRYEFARELSSGPIKEWYAAHVGDDGTDLDADILQELVEVELDIQPHAFELNSDRTFVEIPQARDNSERKPERRGWWCSRGRQVVLVYEPTGEAEEDSWLLTRTSTGLSYGPGIVFRRVGPEKKAR